VVKSEKESERERVGNKTRERERGPLPLSKQLVNDCNPIKHGAQLALSQNVH